MWCDGDDGNEMLLLPGLALIALNGVARLAFYELLFVCCKGL